MIKVGDIAHVCIYWTVSHCLTMKITLQTPCGSSIQRYSSTPSQSVSSFLIKIIDRQDFLWMIWSQNFILCSNYFLILNQITGSKAQLFILLQYDMRKLNQTIYKPCSLIFLPSVFLVLWISRSILITEINLWVILITLFLVNLTSRS